MKLNEPYDDIYQEAVRYDKGQVVVKDMAKAIELYEKSAALGNSKAAATLGYLYENGKHVNEDRAAAKRYYKLAAENDHPVAQTNLGNLLSDSAEYEEALYWWGKASEQNYPLADVCMGRAYERGLGVEQDSYRAYELYSQAASVDNLEGIFRLALCYKDGIGVEKNIPEAIKLLEVVGGGDDPRAWNEFGWLYESGEISSGNPFEAALECYEKAAELGLHEAQAWCGEIYAMGLDREGSLVERDLEKAVCFLESAIAEGLPRAKFIMAVLKARGQGVEKNSIEAFNLCKDAAMSGESDAQFLLGRMFERGEGVKQNMPDAIRWFEEAAENGNPKAKKKLIELRNP